MIHVVDRGSAWVAVSVLVACLVTGCTVAVPGTASPEPGAVPGTVAPGPGAEPYVATTLLGLADMAEAPCEALSADQVRELGHLPPGTQEDEDIEYPGIRFTVRECKWFGPQGGIELSFTPGARTGDQQLPLRVPVTVGGLPGHAVSVGGEYCTLGVDHPDGGITVSTFRADPLAAEQACDGAAALAELVIGNLATGVPRTDPTAVAAPSAVQRWAADPCAALSPAAVDAAVGPGTVPQPETPDRHQAACRWTGPAGSMRLVAVLVATVYDPEYGGRPATVGTRAVLEKLEGTMCSVYARFPFEQLLLLAVDDPTGGAEQACVRARTAAAELFAV